MINRDHFKNLALIHSTECISIYMPTHTYGDSTLKGEDSLVLKNQLSEVKNKLQDKGLAKDNIDKLIAPIQNLIDDTGFWRKQQNGLALFLAPNFFKFHNSLIVFEPYNYVSHEFYLTPLIALLNSRNRFYLLLLELHDTKLYECSEIYFNELGISDVIPSKPEDVVGYDFKQKSLQFRTQQEGHGKASFHGHGEGSDDWKDELESYIRAIDEGIQKKMVDIDLPLVVASVDYLFAQYKKTNTYPHLVEENISGSPSKQDIRVLVSKAKEITDPQYQKKRMNKIALFNQFQGTSRTSSDIKEIVALAHEGRVKNLFVCKNSDIWGIYNSVNQTVKIKDTIQSPNVSLINLVAIQVVLQGGNVYLLEKDEMPDRSSSVVNAFYHY